MRGVVGETAGGPELAVTDAVDADIDLFLDRVGDGRVTSAAITAASVISALASRAGMSSQPFGGGSRPTCEVLICVVFRCIIPSSLASAGDPA